MDVRLLLNKWATANPEIARGADLDEMELLFTEHPLLMILLPGLAESLFPSLKKANN